MTSSPERRMTPPARHAAALAMCWAYAGHAARAVRFSDEAIERSNPVGDSELIADCLDPALAAAGASTEVSTNTDGGDPGNRGIVADDCVRAGPSVAHHLDRVPQWM
jgi:hypothetical protein